MRILARIRDEGLRNSLRSAAGHLSAELVDAEAAVPEGGAAEAAPEGDLLVVEVVAGEGADSLRRAAEERGAALVIACRDPAACAIALAADPVEILVLPVTSAELEVRLRAAHARALDRQRPHRVGATADFVRYRELLVDKLTGFPALPLAIRRIRESLDRHGSMSVLYIHFVWYGKLEEIFGWQQLDEVVATTGTVIRELCAAEPACNGHLITANHVADDDFILVAEGSATPAAVQDELLELAQRIEDAVRERLRDEHGAEIASLSETYAGVATAHENPKVRTERIIYRAIKHAARAARGAEQRERAQRISDLKATLREGAVFIEYDPIVVTGTREVYGYEALARGLQQALRSPEVLFDVAAEANLIWELSRLLRKRAVQGIIDWLRPDQYLFLNVDPQDFEDPAFRNLDARELGIADPSRVVLEITERTAITDYPRLQDRLAAFRAQGFRLAVDDAGSGYAGLGSIANLDPDYIKLDITLISDIDTNFLKQNLVETLVGFAEGRGAQVIAEGVERPEEFETVRRLGVHLAQGFLFDRRRFAGLPAA